MQNGESATLLHPVKVAAGGPPIAQFESPAAGVGRSLALIMCGHSDDDEATVAASSRRDARGLTRLSAQKRSASREQMVSACRRL